MSKRESIGVGRGRSHTASWRRKRRRLVIVLCVLSLLLLPGLVWRVRLAREVRERRSALQEAGQSTSLAALHGGPLPLAPEDNAATYFVRAAGLFRTAPLAHWDHIPYQGKRSLPAGKTIPEVSRIAMEALVAANVATLEQLHAGAKRSRWRYRGIDRNGYGASKSPRAQATEQLTTLLCCEAALLGDKGASAESLQSLDTALVLAASLGDNGAYQSLLFRWELESRIQAVLMRLIGQADYTIEQLRPFREAFAPKERRAQWQRMCDREFYLFQSHIGQGHSRGIARTLLLSAGVGDLNLRTHLALLAEVRAGFGLSWEEQRPHVARYLDWTSRLDAHPLLYATLTVKFGLPPAHWVRMREQWDEAIVADIALSICGYKGKTGAYPEALEGLVPEHLAVIPPLLSDGAMLHYEGGGERFRLWCASEEGGILNNWVVVPTPAVR